MRAVTLLFPIQLEHNRVLLGLKRRGFGAGKLVGIGGGIEANETPVTAALRELLEESGLIVRPEDARFAGSLEFVFSARPAWNMRVHLFTASRWTGVPQPSDELQPEWHSIDALPWERMWQDGRYWLVDVLRGAVIQAQCVYAPDNASVQSFKLE